MFNSQFWLFSFCIGSLEWLLFGRNLSLIHLFYSSIPAMMLLYSALHVLCRPIEYKNDTIEETAQDNSRHYKWNKYQQNTSTLEQWFFFIHLLFIINVCWNVMHCHYIICEWYAMWVPYCNFSLYSVSPRSVALSFSRHFRLNAFQICLYGRDLNLSTIVMHNGNSTESMCDAIHFKIRQKNINSIEIRFDLSPR